MALSVVDDHLVPSRRGPSDRLLVWIGLPAGIALILFHYVSLVP